MLRRLSRSQCVWLELNWLWCSPSVPWQPLRGVVVLKQAIDKMQMNTNQLTSVHADLCQVSHILSSQPSILRVVPLFWAAVCSFTRTRTLWICYFHRVCSIIQTGAQSQNGFSGVWPSGSVLSVSPSVSSQLCLLAKCFKPALPFLELDMMDICKENGAYDAKHFLCYYYYGGMIYTGLKNFERALYFYEQVPSSDLSSRLPQPVNCFLLRCVHNPASVMSLLQAITTPAMAVSHIMLEAYKKYILVSLILHGKVQPLPKYTSQIVGRFIKVRLNDCRMISWFSISL